VPDRGTYESAAGFSIEYPTSWQRLDTGDHPIVFATRLPRHHPARKADGDRRPYLGLDCGRPPTAGRWSAIRSHRCRLMEAASWSRPARHRSGQHLRVDQLLHHPRLQLRHYHFVLHSADPGVYATAPSPFDKAAESAIFNELLGTYRPARTNEAPAAHTSQEGGICRPLLQFLCSSCCTRFTAPGPPPDPVLHPADDRARSWSFCCDPSRTRSATCQPSSLPPHHQHVGDLHQLRRAILAFMRCALTSALARMPCSRSCFTIPARTRSASP